MESVSAWADLLDRINVFPVADADTGRNLIVSLGPLRTASAGSTDCRSLSDRLLFSAKGNSGNIAARFFAGFLAAKSAAELHRSSVLGRDNAWKSIGNPREGTMLGVFDALCAALETAGPELDAHRVVRIVDSLGESVEKTSAILPELKRAGVVDSGALGMFIFFEGFFRRMIDDAVAFPPVVRRFQGKLRISESYRGPEISGHCVDLVVRAAKGGADALGRLSLYGDSVVSAVENNLVRIHVHTRNKDALKKEAACLGEVLEWSDERLAGPGERAGPDGAGRPIHIVADAAGSLSRAESERLGIGLLSSYIITERDCVPETMADSSKIYRDLRCGLKVTTSQASAHEIGQNLRRLLSFHDRVLYLCAGSIYTGNYFAATEWKRAEDPENRLTVIDSGAASGRLACMAVATARFADGAKSADDVVRFAESVYDRTDEYIFPERLEYLAASGRLSRTGALFGDMVGLAPVVTPTREGAKPRGATLNAKAQTEFLMKRLRKASEKTGLLFILLEYSDNRAWVENEIETTVRRKFPNIEILMQPLSLTSGVHIGPGSWGTAWCLENAIHRR